jgi:hypothetical protein
LGGSAALISPAGLSHVLRSHETRGVSHGALACTHEPVAVPQAHPVWASIAPQNSNAHVIFKLFDNIVFFLHSRADRPSPLPEFAFLSETDTRNF